MPGGLSIPDTRPIPDTQQSCVYYESTGSSVVRRLNISLPERTVELIDRIAGKGQRSALIDRAVLRFVQQESRANIRAQLAEGARDRAARDLQLAEEWFPIEATSEDPPA